MTRTATLLAFILLVPSAAAAQRPKDHCPRGSAACWHTRKEDSILDSKRDEVRAIHRKYKPLMNDLFSRMRSLHEGAIQARERHDDGAVSAAALKMRDTRLQISNLMLQRQGEVDKALGADGSSAFRRRMHRPKGMDKGIR